MENAENPEKSRHYLLNLFTQMKKTIFVMCAALYSLCVMSQSNCLEGDLVFRTFNAYSDFTQSTSPQFINGVDTVVITIKGNRVHEYHKSTGIHTIYDNNERVLMWSDNTKEGFNLPYVVQIPSTPPSAFKTQETKTIAGKEGILYKNVTDNMGVVVENEVFITDTDIPIGPNTVCVLNVSLFGKDFENKIAIKNTVNQYQTGKMQEMMKQMGQETWSSQSSELISLSPREVNDNEFSAPSDVNIKYLEQIEPSPELQNGLVRMILKSTLKKVNKDLKKQGMKFTMADVEAAMSFGQYMIDLQKANKAYMQEHGLLNEPTFTERVSYNIEEDWDF